MDQPERTRYFQIRTFSSLPEMRLAKQTGLFPKVEGWRNVVEHELVEAEAADVLAEVLNLPRRERDNLYTAAVLHDVYKRREIELARQKGASGFDESAAQQAKWLRELGYSPEVVELTESVAHTSLIKFQNLDSVSLSQKIIHYVDDITRNNDIVSLDQRIDALEANPEYAELNQQGVAIFGRPYIVVQREVSKKLEAEFAEQIGLENPTKLPMWIRDRIFQRIEESKDIEKIEKIGIEALLNAFRVHNSLGVEGTETVRKNQFGETALKGDIECEEAVLGVLEENGIQIVVHSEEHGIVQIGDNPEYVGTLDGIDGSRVYKADFGKGRYGTMFGIFSNTDPKYKDYIFSGIMEHATGRLFYAVKGKGAFVLENGKRKRIRTTGSRELDPQKVKLLADSDFDKIFQVNVIGGVTNRLPNFIFSTLGSTAAQHASLVNGEADAVIECTRKGNLEIATSFGLITEVGGAVVTLDGTSLGNKKYLEFGQGQTEHIPVISAVTEVLAQNIVGKLKN